jgi:hypothetical protein
MSELQDKVDELFLKLNSAVLIRTRIVLKDRDRVDGLPIHLESL